MKRHSDRKNNRKTTRRISQVYASHWLLILSILTHSYEECVAIRSVPKGNKIENALFPTKVRRDVSKIKVVINDYPTWKHT